MKKQKWIGTAIGLALCAVAFPSCSQGSKSSTQADSNAAAPADTGQISWNSDVEKQLRDAIAQAPANGLKPELFLKGEES